MISVVSIPHTGTRFTLRTLGSLGCETRYARFFSGPEVNAVMSGRRDRLMRSLEWLDNADRVVVPWRCPRKVATSYMTRDKQPPTDAEFDRLAAYFDRPNVHRFWVGGPDKEAGLAALAAFVGVSPQPIDWSPLGHEEDFGLEAV